EGGEVTGFKGRVTVEHGLTSIFKSRLRSILPRRALVAARGALIWCRCGAGVSRIGRLDVLVATSCSGVATEQLVERFGESIGEGDAITEGDQNLLQTWQLRTL